jgi:hypothetical protein
MFLHEFNWHSSGMEVESTLKFHSLSEAAQCSELMPGPAGISIELINKNSLGMLRK